MTDPADIRQQALAFVLSAPHKITPSDLEEYLRCNFHLSRKQCRAVIQELITAEALTYTYQYGRTFIEQSFNKPVRVTNRVLLCPPHRHVQTEEDDIVVQIQAGAAFGSGAHPTTRICIKILEDLLDAAFLTSMTATRCLDVGTGSGILAIAAAKMGIDQCLGIDIDAMAIAEARQNVQLNRLEQRVYISDTSLDNISGTCTLILANLRYPTLSALAEKFYQMSVRRGIVVLSGFRPSEQADIEAIYSKAGFEIVARESENQWAGIGMIKKKSEDRSQVPESRRQNPE